MLPCAVSSNHRAKRPTSQRLAALAPVMPRRVCMVRKLTPGLSDLRRHKQVRCAFASRHALRLFVDRVFLFIPCARRAAAGKRWLRWHRRTTSWRRYLCPTPAPSNDANAVCGDAVPPLLFLLTETADDNAAKGIHDGCGLQCPTLSISCATTTRSHLMQAAQRAHGRKSAQLMTRQRVNVMHRMLTQQKGAHTPGCCGDGHAADERCCMKVTCAGAHRLQARSCLYR